MEKPWPIFFFDGNMRFGLIDSPDKLRELFDPYTLEQLWNAKIAPEVEIRKVPAGYFFGAPEVPTGKRPSFGFRREHTGTVILGNWLKKHGIVLADYAPPLV
jgi:hypothetical protein